MLQPEGTLTRHVLSLSAHNIPYNYVRWKYGTLILPMLPGHVIWLVTTRMFYMGFKFRGNFIHNLLPYRFFLILIFFRFYPSFGKTVKWACKYC